MMGRARWGRVRKWAVSSRATCPWVCSREYLSQEMLQKVHGQIGLENSARCVFLWRLQIHIWILKPLKYSISKSNSLMLLRQKLLRHNQGIIVFFGEEGGSINKWRTLREGWSVGWGNRGFYLVVIEQGFLKLLLSLMASATWELLLRTHSSAVF